MSDTDIGFDTRELRELLKRMNMAQGEGIDQFIKECLYELAFRLDAKVKPRTPVDTGLLRSSWRIGEFRKIASGYQIEYFNNTEYAAPVEFGHRNKGGGFTPGYYMLTISERELQQEMESILEARLEIFMRRIFEG